MAGEAAGAVTEAAVAEAVARYGTVIPCPRRSGVDRIRLPPGRRLENASGVRLHPRCHRRCFLVQQVGGQKVVKETREEKEEEEEGHPIPAWREKQVTSSSTSWRNRSSVLIQYKKKRDLQEDVKGQQKEGEG